MSTCIVLDLLDLFVQTLNSLFLVYQTHIALLLCARTPRSPFSVVRNDGDAFWKLLRLWTGAYLGISSGLPWCLFFANKVPSLRRIFETEAEIKTLTTHRRSLFGIDGSRFESCGATSRLVGLSCGINVSRLLVPQSLSGGDYEKVKVWDRRRIKTRYYAILPLPICGEFGSRHWYFPDRRYRIVQPELIAS